MFDSCLSQVKHSAMAFYDDVFYAVNIKTIPFCFSSVCLHILELNLVLSQISETTVPQALMSL